MMSDAAMAKRWLTLDEATRELVIDELSDINPDAMLLEPRDYFDKALVGWTEGPDDHWPRKPGVAVAVYDTKACLDAIKCWLGCDDEEALEWFDFNTSGAWVGEGTPTFMWGDEE